MEHIRIIGYHGWGFDASFWNAWDDLVPGHITFAKADRGYFGEAAQPEFGDSETKILFLHSFGLHWCPAHQLQQADFIVLFNGFDSFIPEADPVRKRLLRVLEGMEDAFGSDPKAVLKQFYHNCFGRDQRTGFEFRLLDTELLQRDLSSLKSVSLDLSTAGQTKWIIFDADQDKIVPGKRGRAIAKQILTSDYHLMGNSHHALPVQKAEECYKILTQTLPIFDPQ